MRMSGQMMYAWSLKASEEMDAGREEEGGYQKRHRGNR
jgi:hypothetical protein